MVVFYLRNRLSPNGTIVPITVSLSLDAVENTLFPATGTGFPNLNDLEGEGIWILIAETSDLDSGGNSIAPEIVNVISKDTLHQELESAIGRIGNKIDWGTLQEDDVAPQLLELVPPLNETILRIILGLSLVLFLPGYSLIGILFPRKNELSSIERIAISFVLSFAVVSFMGLILNFTAFGIRSAPVLIGLSTFTISLSLVEGIIRMNLPVEERFRVPFDRILKVNLGQSILDKGLSILLIATIIISFSTLVYVMVTPKTGERFTEFYILGPNGIASNYPTDLKFGEEGKGIIGIINQEYENVSYRLEVTFNGTLIHKELFFLIENEKLDITFIFKATNK